MGPDLLLVLALLVLARLLARLLALLVLLALLILVLWRPLGLSHEHLRAKTRELARRGPARRWGPRIRWMGQRRSLGWLYWGSFGTHGWCHSLALGGALVLALALVFVEDRAQEVVARHISAGIARHVVVVEPEVIRHGAVAGDNIW